MTANPATTVPEAVAALDPAALADQAGAENFPVALALLGRAAREDLRAIYGFARLVDDVGDRAPGDRIAGLDWVEAELDRALAGDATHPVFVALGATARRIGVGREPFVDLVAANRQDQLVSRYPRYADLEAYCALSANPVGRLVLAVFGRTDARAAALSDSICTGLQLVEHWQDVGEDFAAGRVYLPVEDLERFAVPEAALGARAASPELRRLLAFEVGRARRLLDAGRPLVDLLGGTARLAIAGFIGGGLAQLDAIERAGYDVLAAPVKASKWAVARRSLRVRLGQRSGAR